MFMRGVENQRDAGEIFGECCNHFHQNHGIHYLPSEVTACVVMGVSMADMLKRGLTVRTDSQTDSC